MKSSPISARTNSTPFCASATSLSQRPLRAACDPQVTEDRRAAGRLSGTARIRPPLRRIFPLLQRAALLRGPRRPGGSLAADPRPGAGEVLPGADPDGGRLRSLAEEEPSRARRAPFRSRAGQLRELSGLPRRDRSRRDPRSSAGRIGRPSSIPARRSIRGRRTVLRSWRCRQSDYLLTLPVTDGDSLSSVGRRDAGHLQPSYPALKCRVILNRPSGTSLPLLIFRRITAPSRRSLIRVIGTSIAVGRPSIVISSTARLVARVSALDSERCNSSDKVLACDRGATRHDSSRSHRLTATPSPSPFRGDTNGREKIGLSLTASGYGC